MSIQVIKKDNKPEWAILPYADHIELLSDHEDHKKIKTFKEKLSRRQLVAHRQLTFVDTVSLYTTINLT